MRRKSLLRQQYVGSIIIIAFEFDAMMGCRGSD